MSLLSDNMRYLRAQLHFSQQKVADSLSITRGRYAKYEDGLSEPPVEILVKISRFFNVSIDLLVTVDLRKIALKDIITLPDNRIVLPVLVDTLGNNSIEIVPHKAQMGYLSGYSDPEYMESLQQINLPFLTNGKFRAFPTEGDSMPPHKEGALIIGKYVDDLHFLKEGKTYVFITRNEGVSYKRLQEITNESVLVAADNTFYEPYHIAWHDILEIWEFACSIAQQEFHPTDFNVDQQTIKELLIDLKKDVQLIKVKL